VQKLTRKEKLSTWGDPFVFGDSKQVNKIMHYAPVLFTTLVKYWWLKLIFCD
jgi:hypothetical protein